MWDFFVCLLVFCFLENQIGIIELGFVLKKNVELEIMSTLLTHNLLQQHLLEAGVMSCSPNIYYKKFWKVLGECVWETEYTQRCSSHLSNWIWTEKVYIYSLWDQIYLQCLLLNTNPSARGETGTILNSLVRLMNLNKIYTNVIRKLEKFPKKVIWQEWKKCGTKFIRN